MAKTWSAVDLNGVVLFNFTANGPCQISLQLGEIVKITEQSENWFRGISLGKEPKKGIFPRRFVGVFQYRDPTLKEFQGTLNEWLKLLRSHYKDRKFAEFANLRNRVVPVVELCRKLSAVSMDDKLYLQMRTIIESKMADAQRAVASELLIRLDGGDIATEKNTGIIKLCKLHEDAAKTQASSSSGGLIGRGRALSLANVRENLESTAGPISPSSYPGTLKRTKTAKAEKQRVSLMVNVQAFMCPVGEPAEVFLSIWNKTNGKYLSEEFRAEFTAQGMPVDLQKIGCLKTVFRDLPAPVTGANDDESVELVLVVRIVRKGKMIQKDGQKGPDYRRPYGGAVLLLTSNQIGKPEQEFTLPVYAPSDEKTFATLHESILKASGVELIPKAKGIVTSIQLFQSETPAKYKDDPVTRPLAFPEPLLPGMQINDFYVTIDQTEITQDRPGQQKNLEIIAKLRHDQGAFLVDCNGDKPRSEFRSVVYYHNNSPRFSETFRLSLPPDTFNFCHLYFEFRLGTKTKEKPAFAVGFFKPTKLDGTVVDDTKHFVSLMRPTKLENEPWYLKQLGQDPKVVRKGEQLTLSTMLVSTQLTKNISLLSLLRWKMVPQNMADVLKRVTFVSPVEIRRFLNDTFDALFGILDAHGDHTQLVYEAIVYIISVFLDDKAMRSDERDALDLYISKHFNAPNAHRQLMSMLKRTFSSSEPGAAKSIGLSLKALEYLFKFIISSRLTHSKRYPSQAEDVTFKRDILDFFKAFNALMAKSGPTMIGTQTIALKGFSFWFNDMSQIFNATELAHIAVAFLDSVQVSEKASPVNAEKLIVIHHLVRGPIFGAEEPRSVLLPALLKHVKGLLDRLNPEESDTAILLIMGMIEALESPGRVFRNQSDALSLLGLLPGLLILINQLTVLNDPRRVRLVICVLAILHMGSGSGLDAYVASLEPAERHRFQTSLLHNLSTFITSQSMPPNWFALVMFQHSATLYVLHTWSQQLLGSRRSTYNVTPEDATLWTAQFELCVAFIRSKALQMETFPSSKRELLAKRYGDYRLDAVEILRSLWNASGQFIQVTTVELVTITLTLTMIDQPEIRQMGMQMYTSLLDRDFLRMTKLSIDALDVLSAAPEFDTSFADFFQRSVQEKFAQASEQSHKGREFTNAVRELLELTQALRERPVDSGYDDDRTSAAIKLMDYLRQADRKDSYIRYIYLLVNEHLKCKRCVEAGNTILLHADLLEWRDDKLLEKQGDYGRQSERERKEQIFRTAIEYFTKGKHYERAISLYEDLKQIYRDILFDYTSLATVLEQQSKLYLLLNEEERVFHEYFRVAFYGAAFPPAIRNKEFIYRGFDFERIAEFVARIQTRYPKAEMVKFTERPPPAYYTADKMYIQIFNVRASSLDEAEGNSRAWNERVPPSIRRFQEFNNVTVFVYSKRVKKQGYEDDSNPFKSLWLLNTFYETAEPLPSIQHRSEVISTVEIETAPLDNALKALESKNFDLQQMVTKYSQAQKTDNAPDLKPLSMMLKGTITAVVNGGIKNYADAFFTDEYTMSQPMKVDALKRTLQQHSMLLGKLLKYGLLYTLVNRLDCTACVWTQHCKACRMIFSKTTIS